MINKHIPTSDVFADLANIGLISEAIRFQKQHIRWLELGNIQEAKKVRIEARTVYLEAIGNR